MKNHIYIFFIIKYAYKYTIKRHILLYNIIIMIKAIAVFDTYGIVKFTEENNEVKIELFLSGLDKNALHGFHVHEAGDLTDTCDSMCAHF